MKKLVIITHPNIDDSIINKTWKSMLENNTDEFVVHSLYDVYPNLNYDIKKEQKLLE